MIEVRPATLVIADGDDAAHAVACAELKQLKQAKKRIVEEFKKIKDPIAEGLARVRALEQGLVAQIDTRITVWDRGIREWRSAETVRREAEAEARRIAEQARLQAERAAQAAAARAVAEVSAPESQGSLLQWAEQIEAAPVRATAIAPTPIATGNTPEVDRWHVTRVDLKLLVDAVAAGTAPIEYVQPNLVELNKAARALKTFCKIPGVTVERETSLVSR